MELAQLRPFFPFRGFQVRLNFCFLVIVNILFAMAFQQCHQKHHLIHPMQQIEGDVIFIRHAESLFNHQTLQYVSKKQMAYDWQHLSQDHQYLSEVKYNSHLLDATITEKGYQECGQAKDILSNYKPDLILVSPLNRTLLTCSLIFPQPTCPVIVQPILSQALRSSCDFSSQIEYKKKEYPHYNFDKVEKEGDFYFINNQSQQNRKEYLKIIESNKEAPHRDTLNKIFEMMLQTWIYQTGKNLRERTSKVKSLLREYGTKYKNIAVVTHYNIIRYTLAKEFNEHNEPFHCQIKNCEIRSAYISQL